MLEVYPEGTQVRIGGRFTGWIVAVILTRGQVMYEVVYWDEGGERCSVSVLDCEVEPLDKAEPRTIGFKGTAVAYYREAKGVE